MKVFFIGAGPGDPELITVKGKRLVEDADIIIYAGSLVNPKILSWAKSSAAIFDSSGMTLDEVTGVYAENREKPGVVARLHTGDPALYGAIQEQIDFCAVRKIPYETVPGVSSVFAAAAALNRELTLPGISQTLILSRAAGRTDVPDAESLEILASHGATLALYLSVDKIDEVRDRLRAGYADETPATVVYRASWPDQKIITGTLADIGEKTRAAGITRQAVILVGNCVGAKDYGLSKLYDPGFSHGFREGKK